MLWSKAELSSLKNVVLTTEKVGGGGNAPDTYLRPSELTEALLLLPTVYLSAPDSTV